MAKKKKKLTRTRAVYKNIMYYVYARVSDIITLNVYVLCRCKENARIVTETWKEKKKLKKKINK